MSEYAHWSNLYSTDPNEDDYRIIRAYKSSPEAGWSQPPEHVKAAMDRIDKRRKQQQEKQKQKAQSGSGHGHGRCGAITKTGTVCQNRKQQGHSKCHLH